MLSPLAQPGILAPVPQAARYLVFSVAGQATDAEVREALTRLLPQVDGLQLVLGMGPSLLTRLKMRVPGLRELPALQGVGVHVPSTPAALWCWLRSDAPWDQQDFEPQIEAIEQALAPAFRPGHRVNAFLNLGANGKPHDLTGFEDGTENPEGDAAQSAALVADGSPLAGSSFVAVQQWLHDMPAFDALDTQAQDHAVGRRRSDNEELDDAPASAHVKRTAQESFTPEAFVLRRSMPWTQGARMGLQFVAFGATLDAFEAQLRRMVGLEDGVVDALFQFSKPVNGAYFWCPPMAAGRLNLSLCGL